MPVTRRERLRRETERAIAAAALEHLATHGAAGLSLRAVARDVGMSPAGLYRYVDGRDDLLTQLIVDGYDALADHLLVAVGGTDLAHPEEAPRPGPGAVPADAPATDRLRAVSHAYRRWAVAHSNHFALLYGDPVPGYEAPADGRTTAASTRAGQALGTPLVELLLDGGTPLRGSDAPALTRRTGPLEAALPPGVEPRFAGSLLLAWARLHGVVTLELNGQLDYLFGADGAGPLLDATLDGMLAEIAAPA